MVLALALTWGALTQPAQASFWQGRFRSPPPRPPKDATSRGDDFCAIAPLATTDTGTNWVWSTQPTLVWQGVATQVHVYSVGSRQPVWQQSITAQQQIANLDTVGKSPVYQVQVSEPLQPGATYEMWVFYGDFSPNIVRFWVMDAPERDRIAAELQQLEAAIAPGDITSEAVTTQRANYFAGQQLWSEFWQELRSLSALSGRDWNQFQSNTIGSVCPLINTAGFFSSSHSTTTADGKPYRDHSFTLDQAQSLEIEVQNPSFGTQISILRSPTDPTSTEPAELIQTWTSSEGKLTEAITLSQPGNYLIRVQAATAQDRGEYQLLLMPRW
ncbi:hypothetical protein ACQ4M4_14655 [Leptolyngbya sp. AN02str]|uniref:hypothetical protein n=1 Tax=Leptolyngbya sp. AN02str TaxID=3423363 RepID=UPI003D30FBA1